MSDTLRPARLGAGRWLASLAATGVAFGALDALWLGVLAKEKYASSFGSLMADPVNVPAAAAFYGIYTVGLTHFATAPGVASGSVARAAGQGAALGLVAYAAYDLTSLAVIEGFPADVVPLDLAWGAVASGVAAAVATAVLRRRSDR
ncbi:DUF2177 family protein [Serinicoccus kebangsaanensis]|uniref:DUF2177 family protein n=1 Tax=Serinicoccus kebangsaanensis TaxID=2602069 RepID=UPI00192D3C29|nr:DUF2177 family protein [Serinicoccus kebangsaanensis]